MTNQAATVPVNELAANFWKLISTNHVRISVDMRRVIGHDNDQQSVYWDSASFSNEVAKALIAGRGREPIEGVLQAIQFVMIEAIEGIRPISNSEATRIVDALNCAGYVIRPMVKDPLGYGAMTKPGDAHDR